jgi:hypothetical protein
MPFAIIFYQHCRAKYLNNIFLFHAVKDEVVNIFYVNLATFHGESTFSHPFTRLCGVGGDNWLSSYPSRELCYGFESVRIRVNTFLIRILRVVTAVANRILYYFIISVVGRAKSTPARCGYFLKLMVEIFLHSIKKCPQEKKCTCSQ